GGLIEVFRSPSGVVQQLGLIGAVPGRSTLTGSVRRGRGGTGRTILPPITGAAGVRITLKSPPFLLSKTVLALSAREPATPTRVVPLVIPAQGHFARRRWRR